MTSPINLSDRHLEGFSGLCNDELQHGPFARRFSVGLASGQIDIANGLVIALDGNWGSGKSTVAAYCRTLIESAADLLENHSSASTICEEERSKILRRLEDASEKDGENRVIRDLEALRGCQDHVIVDSVQPWLNDSPLGLKEMIRERIQGHVVALSRSIADAKGSEGETVLSAIVKSVGESRKQIEKHTLFVNAAKAVTDAANNLEGVTVGLFGVSRSIDEAQRHIKNQENLRKALCDLYKKAVEADITPWRIVLFIDDIDRLLPQAIYDLIVAVRANLNMPGLVIVLLYDEERVHRALAEFFQHETEKEPHDAAAEFMQKIVEITYHLRKPMPEEFIRLFNSFIYKSSLNEFRQPPGRDKGAVISSSQKVQAAGASHWRNIETYILRETLDSPRDAKRLFNNVAFNWQMVRSDLCLEDFIGVHALRLFLPEEYRLMVDKLQELLEADEPPEGRFDTNAFRTLFRGWAGVTDLDEIKAFGHPDFALLYIDNTLSADEWIHFSLDRLIHRTVTACDVEERLLDLHRQGELESKAITIAERLGSLPEAKREVVLNAWHDAIDSLAQRGGSIAEIAELLGDRIPSA